jgi:hypothetical protein
MSLVAALAVAGLSSTASAGSLEEAIKGVNISGKMEVEYDYNKTNTGVANAEDTTSDTWDLDWDVTAKIPVNDMVTAVFGMQGDNAVATQEGGEITDQSPTVTKQYFQYANGPVTAMVGKQGFAGAPWFDDERANGVVALYNAGVATFAAGYFTNSNANPVVRNNTVNTNSVALGSTTSGGDTNVNTFNNTNIAAAAVITKLGPVNAQLWYAQLTGIDDDNAVTTANSDQISASSYVLMADAQFDIVNLALTYGEAEYDVDNPGTAYNIFNDDASMLKVVASAGLDVATVYAGYGATDDKQGGAGLDLTSDTDSAMDFGSETLSIDDLDNADAYIIGATVPMGAWKFDVSYVTGDYDGYIDGTTDKDSATAYDADFSEFLVQADYKMSKNFTIGAHYSDAEIENVRSATLKETVEINAASVSLEYKF